VSSALHSPAWARPLPLWREDVPALAVAAGLCQDACATLEEVAGIAEDRNTQGTEYFDMDELVAFLGRVSEVARALARKREGGLAKRLGLAPEQVLHLRLSFADLTQTGVLRAGETRRLLKEISPSVDPSDAEIHTLLDELMQAEGGTRAREPAAPAAADPAAARAPASLLFSGYLRLMGVLMGQISTPGDADGSD